MIAETEDEEIEFDEPFLREYGSSKKALMTLYGDIKVASRCVWRTLTETEHMPVIHDDLINDHIKPTREFRKRIVSEMDQAQRQNLHYRLKYIERILGDTLQIIDGENKK